MSEHHAFLVEESQPKNRNLFVWGFVIAAVLGTLTTVLTSVFYYTWNQQRQNQIQPDAALVARRQQDAQALNTYGWVDKEKGIVSIPIEEAMRLEVKRENNQ